MKGEITFPKDEKGLYRVYTFAKLSKGEILAIHKALEDYNKCDLGLTIEGEPVVERIKEIPE